MKYRNYGKTGIEVSALGFGGMRFEDPKDHDKSAATVLHAFEKGVNYFDTAPYYCEDQSEAIMGKAILEMKKSGKPFFVSTKSSQEKGDDVRRDLEKSLKRLNVEAIDFYHCWYLLTLEGWERRKSGGAVQEILKAKEEGLIRHAVFSTHLPGSDIRKVVEEGIFEGVTLGYSAVNFPYRQEGVDAAAQHGLGVVVMNPLGGGTIVTNEKAFGFIKVHEHQSMLEAALHFLLAHQNITVSLVGFRNNADVDSAIASVESYAPYSEEEFESIKKRIHGEFNDLCTSCMYCKGCPENIPVWMFMETYNHLMLKDGEKLADRLKWHWGTHISELDRCTECGLCEAACTQHLPIIERFGELKKALAQGEKNVEFFT